MNNTSKRWDVVKKNAAAHFSHITGKDNPEEIGLYNDMELQWDYISNILWEYGYKNPLTNDFETRYITPLLWGEKGMKGIPGLQGITATVSLMKNTAQGLLRIDPKKISLEFKNEDTEDSEDQELPIETDLIVTKNMLLCDHVYIEGTLKTRNTEKGGLFFLSDKRIKKDIEKFDLEKAYSIIKNIEPVEYKIYDTNNMDYYPEYGYIAQDVYKIFPEAINNKNTDYINNVNRIVENVKWDEILDETNQI